MSFRSDMVTYLKNFSALNSLISGRVRSLKPRQNDTFPLVTYWIVSEDPEYDLDGDAGVTEKRVRFVSWGGHGNNNDVLADSVNEQLRLALSGFVGTFTSTTINSVQKDNERDVVAQAQDGSDQHDVGIESDYLFVYQQVKPSFS